MLGLMTYEIIAANFCIAVASKNFVFLGGGRWTKFAKIWPI